MAKSSLWGQLRSATTYRLDVWCV